MPNTLFLIWYDDNPRTTVPQRISAACDAYERRFDVRPSLVLVSVDEVGATAPAGVVMMAVQTLRKDTYWVGRE